MSTMNGTKRRAVGEQTPDDVDLDEAIERYKRRLNFMKDVKHMVALCAGKDGLPHTAHGGVPAFSFDDAMALCKRMRDFERDVSDLISKDEVNKMRAKKKAREEGESPTPPSAT